MPEITLILSSLKSSKGGASDDLLPLVYEELRKLAAAKLACEKAGQTLQPTALAHEAFLRLVDVPCQKDWESRNHFFAAAAEAMRRILVEAARRKKCLKHGGGLKREELAEVAVPESDDRLLALDDAMLRLAAEDPVAARVMELRHFGGLGHAGIALELGITTYQARQKWSYARAWLREYLTE